MHIFEQIDSLGMVINGHKNTRSVTMQDMLYHTEIVANSCQQALVIADMPFMSYDSSELALINAQNLVDVGADMSKWRAVRSMKRSSVF